MSSFCIAKATHIFFSKKFQHICVSFDVNFNESLTNDIVSFEQLGPGFQNVYGKDLVPSSWMHRLILNFYHLIYTNVILYLMWLTYRYFQKLKLTVKVPSKIVTRSLIFFYYYYFQRKKKVEVSCESSARQLICMKCKSFFFFLFFFFFEKSNKKYLKSFTCERS